MLAKYSIMGKKIPISQEVASVLANITSSDNANSSTPVDRSLMIRKDNVIAILKKERNKLIIIPCGTTTYAVRQRGGYGNLWDGTVTVFLEFLYNLSGVLCQVFVVPDRYARNYGMRLIRQHAFFEMPTYHFSLIIFISEMCLLPTL